jgi:hypothetical protein
MEIFLTLTGDESHTIMQKTSSLKWPRSENRVIFLILFIIFLLMGSLILLSEGFYGGGDSMAHFRISRYAFKYPHLFLDHWGKPVFTILSAPFSQLGFNGLRFYNLLAALLTAWFLFRLVQIFKWRGALLAPVFLLCSPLYFVIIFSGLTEITFGLVLLAGIYFWFRNKPGWSALIFSLLPFVRTEAILLIPIFIAGFMIYGRWRYLPLFFSGFLAFSLVGWFVYDDVWWVVRQMPYTGARAIYGSGSLFHFLGAMPGIMGWPLLLLFILGGMAFLLQVFRKGSTDFPWPEVLVFIILPWMAYLGGHSVAWWKGMGGSLGLIRVMAAVIPLAIILSVAGYDLLARLFIATVRHRILLPMVIIPAIIFVPFSNYRVPLKLDAQHQLLKQAATWVRTSPYVHSRIYYHDLFFLHCLGIDPFDQEQCIERLPDRTNPGNGIPSGSLVQWDAHYGPNEGGLPLERLIGAPGLTMLVKFTPEEPFEVLGGHPYEIYIFRKN